MTKLEFTIFKIADHTLDCVVSKLRRTGLPSDTVEAVAADVRADICRDLQDRFGEMGTALRKIDRMIDEERSK